MNSWYGEDETTLLDMITGYPGTIQRLFYTCDAKPSFTHTYSLAGAASSNTSSFHHKNVSLKLGVQFEGDEKANSAHRHQLEALLDRSFWN